MLKKTSKNDAQGVPELTPNGSELIEKIAKIAFLTFGLEFSPLFGEKSMNASMHFFKVAFDFFNMATP